MIVQKIKIYIQIYVINLFNLFEFIFTSKFKVREFALKVLYMNMLPCSSWSV